MYNEKFKKRFEELATASSSMKIYKGDSECFNSVDAQEFYKWATSVQNLVKAVFGMDSPHYNIFLEKLKKFDCYESSYIVLKGVFESAKEDFDNGYLFDVELAISGELFGDFIVMAKKALEENSKDVAAVLACAALEDALKRFALINEVDVVDNNMTEVINALKAKGLVRGTQKALLKIMPKIRNDAMHASWDRISSEDVGSVIGFTERFLLSHFN